MKKEKKKKSIKIKINKLFSREAGENNIIKYIEYRFIDFTLGHITNIIFNRRKCKYGNSHSLHLVFEFRCEGKPSAFSVYIYFVVFPFFTYG